MTLALIWPHGHKNSVTSLNIATDSRLSDTQGHTWDHGTKVFRIYPSHHYLVYCGDSILALQAILQAIAIVNSSRTLGQADGPKCPQIGARASAVVNHLRVAFQGFPQAWAKQATLLLCGFDYRDKKFKVHQLTFDNQGFTEKPLKVAMGSYIVMGSGENAAKKRIGQLGRADFPGMLSVLQATIDDPSVKTVGGFPQMTMIRKADSKPVGFRRVIDARREYLLWGLPLRFRSTLCQLLFLDEQHKSCPYKNSAVITPVGKVRKRK
jgi:hypothetical protein